MKISVAITLYNGEDYILEQLESIRTQSLLVDEVILCDDGSTDSTVSVVKDYITKHKLNNQWQLYINEKNLGYAGNFFKAIKKTTGDIIFFSDQDDIWLKDRVEKMIRVLKTNKAIQMMGSEFEPFYFTDDAPRISKKVIRSMSGNGNVEHIKLNHKTIFIGSEGCTMCIRRSFFNRIEPYWFEGWAHDEFVWKMALCEDSCYIYHEKTLKRRMHSNNVSKRKMRNNRKRVLFLDNLLRSHKAMLEYAKKVGLSTHHLVMINKNIASVKLRIELLRDKKIINTLWLIIKYSKNYHSRKSIPVELLMALRNR